MPSLEEFCQIKGSLGLNVIGNGPAGMRIDFPFEGTATSSHWEGELPVVGTDYATVRGDGNMNLDIHGVIGEGREKIGYKATGVSIAVDKDTAHPQELMLFETQREDLAFLNTSLGVALGTGGGGNLEITVYLVKP
ncbi:MAG: DUF3237 family protein [Acidimicrobiia bacterium]